MARGRVPRKFPRSIAFMAVMLESARGVLPPRRSLFATFSKNVLLGRGPPGKPINLPLGTRSAHNVGYGTSARKLQQRDRFEISRQAWESMSTVGFRRS